MPRVVSFIVLLAVIVLIGSMFFQVMVQFIVPLFLAAVLVVIFKPLHLWVLSKLGDRVRIAAAVTTFLIVMIVLLPLSAMLIRAISEATEQYVAFRDSRAIVTQTDENAIENSQTDRTSATEGNVDAESPKAEIESAEAENTAEAPQKDTAPTDGSADEQVAGAEDTESSPTLPLGASQDETVVDEDTAIANIIPNVTVDTNALMAVVEEIVPKINEFLKRFHLPLLVTEAVVQYVGDFVERVAAPLALDGVKILFSTLFSLAIMVLTLYYFFADGPNMVVALMKLSPLDDTYEQELLDKFADVSRSVVVAVLLSAIAQGLLAGIGYFFAGVQNVFLCTVLTCFLAMVPFVGATIIWIPICLVLAYVGHPTAAIVLAVYCATVVSMVDNLIKPLVLHGQANLHPLLALLSVIGGIQALGPIGILVGPMLVAFLQALLNMLNKELELLGKESDETGTPVVFATDSAGETAATPAALPTPKQAKKQKRRRKK